ncbi:MAG: hypothetical protein R8K50_00175 [Mariprofundus sp.]
MIGHLLSLINWKAGVLSLLAIISTFICIRFGITADFPMSLVATAVVFPMVFSINGAYERRERALAAYGAVKANGHAIHLSFRDWPHDFDTSDMQHKSKTTLAKLMSDIRSLLYSPVSELSVHEIAVYHSFSDISKLINTDLRRAEVNPSELSRSNQFLSKMLIAFEDLKHIHEYRTPKIIREFSGFFVCVLPVLYGPYFALLSAQYEIGLAYVMPVVLTLVLVSLESIQKQLENPYDQLGDDDVHINVEHYMKRLQAESVHPSDVKS